MYGTILGRICLLRMQLYCEMRGLEVACRKWVILMYIVSTEQIFFWGVVPPLTAEQRAGAANVAEEHVQLSSLERGLSHAPRVGCAQKPSAPASAPASAPVFCSVYRRTSTCVIRVHMLAWLARDNAVQRETLLKRVSRCMLF